MSATKLCHPPQAPLEARVRAYARRSKSPRSPWTGGNRLAPGVRRLIIDTETDTGPAQRLRFGAFQLRDDDYECDRDYVEEEGLFFDPAGLSTDDRSALEAYAAQRGLRLYELDDFIEEILFARCVDYGGMIIGFNLPFDLSRLATGHATARTSKNNRSMQDAFTFEVSPHRYRPRVRIKHGSRRMAFYALTKTRKNAPNVRGYFVDVKTLAAALLSASHSLESLSGALGVENPKQASLDHGGPVTPDYIDYCRADVQATWECYKALEIKLAAHGLPDAHPCHLYSEASLGKAYLSAMNVKPWRTVQPDFPPQIIGQIMSAYFGGRSEVRIRRQIRQSFYCDFLSMYPTMCALMGLWRFITAKGVETFDATQRARDLLARATPETFQDQAAWKQLAVICQVHPDDDVLPLRAVYGEDGAANIALNRITSQTPLWYTLADCIAAKALSGKAPDIISAIGFDPKAAQSGLRPLKVAGNPDFRVDPAREDFFKAVINLRRTVKTRMNAASGTERDRLADEQLALKILANATSYGMFIELNVERSDKAETLTCFGPAGEGFSVRSKIQEKPGTFFHPLLATLITGAARLMLALAERKATDEGLGWTFCDTDGIAFAKPEAMDGAEFITRARRVIDWFEDLNPYDARGSILQAEAQNFRPGEAGDWTALEALYCYAVSAKRYALFNLDAGGAPVIRKASAHGLGHFLPPYPDPEKANRLREKNVELWQEDLWCDIITAALKGEADELAFTGRPGFEQPAASRYGAVKPGLLRWFDGYNEGRPYEDQVRPFNFMIAYTALPLGLISASDPDAAAWLNETTRDPAPVAPFDTNPARGAESAFDRRTGKPVPKSWLKTYARALAQYHLHPEPKFHGGDDWTGSGELERRRINVIGVRHIGKEADNLEEAYYLGETDDNAIEYEAPLTNPTEMIAVIGGAKRLHGVRALRSRAAVSDHTLKAALSPERSATIAQMNALYRAALALNAENAARQRETAELIEWAKVQSEAEGVKAFAARVGIDASNLGKVLRGVRRLTNGMRAELTLLQSVEPPNR